MPTDAADVPTRVRSAILGNYRTVVEAVLDAADAVARDWDAARTTDRDAVTIPLERELDRRGVTDSFPAVLAGTADTAGLALRSRPVPAPPYVVVTSTGVVLRATTDAGRLVIAVRAFDVERGDPTRYRLRDVGPDGALVVELR